MSPHHEAPTFQELMAEQLRHAPWLAFSLLIHVVAVVLIMLVPSHRVIESTLAVSLEPPSADEPIEELPPPPDEPIEPEAPPDDPELQTPELEDVPLPDAPTQDFASLADVADMTDLASIPLVGFGGTPSRMGVGRRARRDALQRRGSASVVVIDRALQWLVDHQDPDGRWDADGFMKHDLDGEPCDGPGDPVHDVGVTALALLAFLGDGSNLRGGPHRDVVKKAVGWLRAQQDDSGLIGTATSSHFIYDHAIAALAMVEAYGLSDSTILRRHAQAALNYLEAHRNPYMVWRYQPQSLQDDSSVTGWCLMAYKTGRDFGLQVNERALTLCGTWFDQVTDPATGHCGYTDRGQPSSRHSGDHGTRFPPEKGAAMTAVGLMSRFFLHQDPAQTPVMGRAAATLLQHPPVWDETSGSIDHYYWYYATYALYQMGGHPWSAWSKRLAPAVVRTQREDGNARGSWDPVGVWGEDGGRVYSTAILALTLEAHYRYPRVLIR